MNVILIKIKGLPFFINKAMKCLRLEGFTPIKISLCYFSVFCEEKYADEIFKDLKLKFPKYIFNYQIIKG